jgi:hypothetical protein
MGMCAATRVPLSAEPSTWICPSRPASRSASPRSPLPVGSGASDAVVAQVDHEPAVVDLHRHLGASGASVFDDVGQRLGDDEVGGRLDCGSEPAHGCVDVDGQRHPRSQRVDARAQTALGGAAGRMPCASSRSSAVACLAVVERLGQRLGSPLRYPADPPTVEEVVAVMGGMLVRRGKGG